MRKVNPPLCSTLSKEFESLSKRNGQLERTLLDLQQGMEGKDSNLKDYLNRIEKAELDLLNAQRERTLAEEKVAFKKGIFERFSVVCSFEADYRGC